MKLKELIKRNLLGLEWLPLLLNWEEVMIREDEPGSYLLLSNLREFDWGHRVSNSGYEYGYYLSQNNLLEFDMIADRVCDVCLRLIKDWTKCSTCTDLNLNK